MVSRWRGTGAVWLGASLVFAVALALWLWTPVRFSPKDVCAPAIHVVDRHGDVIHVQADAETGFCEPLPLNTIPEALQQAVIATEDARFFDHPGVDAVGLTRAVWLNAKAGRIVAGGSTITQQVARMLIIGRDACYDQTLGRKLREMALAIRLEAQLSKEEILALYLNQSYWGDFAYGAQAASLAVFAKPAAQLDLAECALLAGMLQGPEYYDPLTNRKATLSRQRIVLGLMAKEGYITSRQAELAGQEPMAFRDARADSAAPHATALVGTRLAELVGDEAVLRGGLVVQTSLDRDLQSYAADQVALHLATLNREAERRSGDSAADNAAVLVLDIPTGAILAMVGSPDQDDERIAGAVNACMTPRQPGSALKPFTYALAFERGYSPSSVVADVRTAYVTREGRPYVPVNYDYQHHGLVSLRRALACSYNTVAVKLLDDVGVESWTDRMRQLGITSLDDAERYGLALTLGSGEVSLLELTAAYGCLAAEGQQVEPYLIERVLDASGAVLYQHDTKLATLVFDPRVAYLVTDVLSDDAARAPSFGEDGVLAQPFPAAVKTGTTTDWRDNWTVGYTAETVVGVWVGNADNRPMRGISGVDGAAPIWHAVLARACDLEGEGEFVMPPGLVEADVCQESGLLPTTACSHRRRELFLAENVPITSCDMHAWATIDARTGELATADCPERQSELVAVTVWTPEVLPWAESQGLVTHVERQVLEDPAVAAERRDNAVPADGASLPRILCPDQGATYRLAEDVPAIHQQIAVQVAADPSQGVVRLVIDDSVAVSWTTMPYDALWSLDPGVHILVAEQLGQDGRVWRSDPISIRILGPAAMIPRERTGS